MPSSTTRTTHLELTILRHFRTIHIFLHRSGYSDEYAILADDLTLVLDVSASGVEELVLPPHKQWQPASTIYDSECEGTGLKSSKDVKEMRALKADWEATVALARGKKRSWCVWEAGSECMEIGDALGAKGRRKEGMKWLEWGVELREMAENEWLKEQKIERLAEAREREEEMSE